MASGFGVDPTIDPITEIVTSSTTSQDIRRILGALYSPGLITGGLVTTSASGMTYTVAAGVAAVRTATGQIVLAPFDQTTVTTTPVTSGNRTDIVYARQNFPAQGNSNVIIGIASSLPANSVKLAQFTLTTNTTNTNSAVRVGNVDYSIPYGSSLGTLHTYVDTRNGSLPAEVQTRGVGKIYVPSDRRIRFILHSTLSSLNAVGFDNGRYCEYAFWATLDNDNFVKWTTGGLHQAKGMYQFETTKNVTAGEHTVGFLMKREVGPGTAVQHYGWDSTGNFRTGTTFTVEDYGVAV